MKFQCSFNACPQVPLISLRTTAFLFHTYHLNVSLFTQPNTHLTLPMSVSFCDTFALTTHLFRHDVCAMIFSALMS